MDRSFYFDRLYPLQDKLVEILGRLETRFYLTGGTAASRGYLGHRFSDDLARLLLDSRSRARTLIRALFHAAPSGG